MGRLSTGAVTTGQAKRIELTYLLKQGILRKGFSISTTLSWNDNSSIAIDTYYTNNEAYIKLSYENTDLVTNKKTSYKYRIRLETIPSNLGKGDVLYFVCPVSGKKCRILYNAYGSGIWKARESYQNRIYYQSQLDPKSMRPYRYLFIDNLLSELYSKVKKKHYKGKPTRILKKIESLQNKHDSTFLKGIL